MLKNMRPTMMPPCRRGSGSGTGTAITDAFEQQTRLLITGNKAAGKSLVDCSYGSNALTTTSSSSNAVQLFSKNVINATNLNEIKTALSADFDMQTDFTLEFWFQQTNNTSYGTLGGRVFFCATQSTPGGIELDLRVSSGSISWSYYDGSGYVFSISGLAAINLNQWYYVAIVQDRTAGTFKLYLDGILLHTANYSMVNTANKLLRFSNVWDNFGAGYRMYGYYADIRYTQAVRTMSVPTTRI